MCIFFEILVPEKGGRKGVRPLLYESWWLNAKFGKKIDIRSVADDIYSIMRSNQCSGNPPPFPHPFSDHVGSRANAMVNRYPWYSGIFFILGVTTEIEGSIKASRTPFRTPFLHHHKVQDQGYILCIYTYAQKCIVIALQNHFRKRDYVSHYEYNELLDWKTIFYWTKTPIWKKSRLKKNIESKFRVIMSDSR